MRRLKQPLRKTAIKLLDAVGIESKQIQFTIDELAERMLARSRKLLKDLPPVKPGQRVVVYGGRSTTNTKWIIDGLLAWALRLRGADVHVVLCDGKLTACELSTVNHYDNDEAFLQLPRPASCTMCYDRARTFFDALKLPVYQKSDFVSPGAWEKAEAFVASLTPEQYLTATYEGVNVGEHVQSTACRTLLRGTFDVSDPAVCTAVRRLLLNAVVVTEATRAIFDRLRPDHVVVDHGIYLTGGIPCEYARSQGIHAVVWSMVYRRYSNIWSHDDTYHRTVVEEPVAHWIDHTLDEEQAARLGEYLHTHWKPGGDWISYNDDNQDDAVKLARELRLDSGRPVVGLFTNVPWDAKIHYSGIVFSDHGEWLLETIRYAISRPDVQWLVRIHPAEVKHSMGETRERADVMIRQAFPELPEHVRIISPESALSSYGLLPFLNAAVVYGTNFGLEVATSGIPVVVAGDAWYRKKGFTLDATDRDGYFSLLENITSAERLTSEQLELAHRYAYHYFFRRMIPFPMLRDQPDAYVVKSLEDLLPGRNPDLDVVCRGVLERAPFVATA